MAHSAAARTITCPSCNAQPGANCTMESTTGSRQFVSTFHYARISTAMSTEEIPA